MKRINLAVVLYCISSLCSYLAAALYGLMRHDEARALIWFCLGTAMLCMGTYSLIRCGRKRD